jgi:rhamnulokinase
VLESLALKHAQTVDLLASVTGTSPTEIHVVGGGARNELMCRWTADASGLPVHAGPHEATLLGNLLVQAMSLDEIASLAEARRVVTASVAQTTYEPRESAAWREARERFAAAVALPTLEVRT